MTLQLTSSNNSGTRYTPTRTDREGLSGPGGPGGSDASGGESCGGSGATEFLVTTHELVTLETGDALRVTTFELFNVPDEDSARPGVIARAGAGGA